MSDMNVVASALFIATAADDISDAAGPGRKCMLQLIPIGRPVLGTLEGRYVRFSNWDMAAFGNGGDESRMVFGVPPANSALDFRISGLMGRGTPHDVVARLQQLLSNQAVYIQQHEIETPRPW
eukprot:COSAG02_NODE_35517_length_467_cov_0.706522_1_plen_123_part_10